VTCYCGAGLVTHTVQVQFPDVPLAGNSLYLHSFSYIPLSPCSMNCNQSNSSNVCGSESNNRSGITLAIFHRLL